ncbi:MAG: hypothetical protein AAGK22_18470 [Acidobacteriota bacterium]
MQTPTRVRKAPVLSRTLATLLLVFAFALPSSAANDAANSASEVQPLLVGTTIPSVTVQTIDGEPIDLLEDARKKPSILVFYRGGW